MGRKSALVLMLGMLFSACAKPPSRHFSVPLELKQHVDNFEIAYHIRSSLPIMFADFSNVRSVSGGAILGWCIYNQAIQFDKNWVDYFNSTYPLALEALVVHEFGHCVLNLKHDSRIGIEGVSSECPRSLMYPESFEESGCYASFREYYLREFAQKAGITLFMVPPEPTFGEK